MMQQHKAPWGAGPPLVQPPPAGTRNGYVRGCSGYRVRCGTTGTISWAPPRRCWRVRQQFGPPRALRWPLDATRALHTAVVRAQADLQDSMPKLRPPSSKGSDHYLDVKILLNMTEDQFKALIEPDGVRWKYHMRDDGWLVAHDCLRYDMSTFSIVLMALADQSLNSPLKDWQARRHGLFLRPTMSSRPALLRETPFGVQPKN